MKTQAIPFARIAENRFTAPFFLFRNESSIYVAISFKIAANYFRHYEEGPRCRLEPTICASNAERS